MCKNYERMQQQQKKKEIRACIFLKCIKILTTFYLNFVIISLF